MKNIVLVGYMGSGKTSVGQYLSEILQRDFIDLDQYIETNESLTISDIFNNKGAVFFRKLEHLALNNVLKNLNNTVISLGGGTPLYYNSMEMLTLRDDCITVYLDSPIKILADRLFKEKKNRPVIAHIETVEQLQEFIAKHLFERRSHYLLAEIHINTTGKSIQEIGQEIISVLF